MELLQASVRTMVICMHVNGNVGCRRQPQPLAVSTGPLTHSWLSVAAWITSLNTVSGSGYTGHFLQHGSLRQQSRGTTEVSLRHQRRHRLYTGSQASLRPGAAAWTTDTSMASGGIAGHGGFWGPVQKRTHHHLWLPSLSRARGVPRPHRRLEGWICTCLSSRLLYIILPTLLGWQWQLVDLSPLSYLSPLSHLWSSFYP